MGVTSYRKQLWMLALLAAFWVPVQAQAPAGSGTPPTTQALKQQPETPDSVQTASLLPEGSILPVAGIVGFSFLIGGIVCGALKPPRS